MDAGNVASFDFTSCDIDPELIPVVKGLISKQKRLPFWYVWDDKGAEMYEEICATSPTYTLWRREFSLIQAKVEEIVSKTPPPTILVELGSGTSSKTGLVIESMLKNRRTLTFIPVDVAKETIVNVGREMEKKYPGLTVEPFGGFYMDGIRHLSTREENKMVLFFGNTFSSVCMYQQVDMMTEIRTHMTKKDRFVMGLDMEHDPTSLSQAYGDQWVGFHRDNRVRRLNEDFDGDMDKTKFEYVYDFVEKPADGDFPSYVAGYLRSSAEQSVNFRKLGITVDFQKGEKFYFSDGPNHTSKWNTHQIYRLAEKTGFAVEDLWTNEASDYCLVCFAPV